MKGLHMPHNGEFPHSDKTKDFIIFHQTLEALCLPVPEAKKADQVCLILNR